MITSLWTLLSKTTHTTDDRAKDLCLGYLEITERDLKDITLKRQDKREYIRRIVESTSPSLGRFMSQVYLAQTSQEDQKSRDKGFTLRQLKDEASRIIAKPTPTKADLARLALIAY